MLSMVNFFLIVVAYIFIMLLAVKKDTNELKLEKIFDKKRHDFEKYGKVEFPPVDESRVKPVVKRFREKIAKKKNAQVAKDNDEKEDLDASIRIGRAYTNQALENDKEAYNGDLDKAADTRLRAYYSTHMVDLDNNAVFGAGERYEEDTYRHTQIPSENGGNEVQTEKLVFGGIDKDGKAILNKVEEAEQVFASPIKQVDTIEEMIEENKRALQNEQVPIKSKKKKKVLKEEKST